MTILRILRSVGFILMLCVMGTIAACGGTAPGEQVLFDFESDEELDQLQWKCHALMSISDEHPSHGTKSLKAELYPSDYPGLEPRMKKNSWEGLGSFSFDVYNPQAQDISIHVRIDDRRDYPSAHDRYQSSFILKPGTNTISIPFDTLITTGTGRKLNLQTIWRVFIFLAHPQEKHTLYFDHIRLAK